MNELDRIVGTKGLKEEAGERWAAVAPRIVEQARLEEGNSNVKHALDVIVDFEGTYKPEHLL